MQESSEKIEIPVEEEISDILYKVYSDIFKLPETFADFFVSASFCIALLIFISYLFSFYNKIKKR